MTALIQYERIIAGQSTVTDIARAMASHQHHEIIEHAISVNCTTYLACLKYVLEKFKTGLDYQRYLSYAIKHNRQNSVKYILEREFSEGDSVVYVAVTTGNYALTELLDDCGFDWPHDCGFDWPHDQLNAYTMGGLSLSAQYVTHMSRAPIDVPATVRSHEMAFVVGEYNIRTRARAAVARTLAAEELHELGLRRQHALKHARVTRSA